MTRDIGSRLGCGANGKADIQAHAFYRGLDWGKLANLEIPPPFMPTVKGNEAVNFDAEFTSEAPNLTPPNDMRFIATIDQAQFAGFSYV